MGETNGWQCTNCTEFNPEVLSVCKGCKTARPFDHLWQCPHCEHINPSYESDCEVCSLPYRASFKWEKNDMALVVSVGDNIRYDGLVWEGQGHSRMSDAPVSFSELTRKIDPAYFKDYFTELTFLDKPSTLPGVVLARYFSKSEEERRKTNRTLMIAAAIGGLLFLPTFKMIVLSGGLVGLSWWVEKKEAKLKKYALKCTSSLFGGSAVSEVLPSAAIGTISYSRDGNELVSGNLAGVITRWKTSSGERGKSQKLFSTEVDQIKINQNGGAVLWDKKLQVLDSYARLTQKIVIQDFINRTADIECSFDLQKIAIPSKGKVILLQKGRTGTSYHKKNLNDQMPGNITAMRFVDSGRKLISGNALGGLMVWDLNKGESLFYNLKKYIKISHICSSPAQMLWATSYISGEIELYSMLSYDKKDSLSVPDTDGEDGSYSHLIFSDFIPGKPLLLGVDDSFTGHIWDLKSGSATPVKSWDLPVRNCSAFKVSEDGEKLAVGTKGGKVYMLNISHD